MARGPTALPAPYVADRRIMPRMNACARAGVLGAAALAVGLLSSTPRGRRIDEEMFRSLNAGAGPGTDRFFLGVTELGSWWAAAGAAVVLAAAGDRRAALHGLGAASITWTAGQGLKRVFRRPRPSDADPGGTRLMIARPHGTSWPSSHPAVLVTFMTVAGRELGIPPLARAALDTLGAVVGLSRPYVGVHYPSDVVGGLLFGRSMADAWTAMGASLAR